MLCNRAEEKENVSFRNISLCVNKQKMKRNRVLFLFHNSDLFLFLDDEKIIVIRWTDSLGFLDLLLFNIFPMAYLS